MDVEWRSSSRSGPNGQCVEVTRRTGWRKSSRSEASDNDCVEVDLGPQVGIRDSKDREPEIWVSRPAWVAFIDAVRAGELSPPSS